MAEEVGAVVLRNGPVRLVFGDDDALSATELAGAGDAIRIGTRELESLRSTPMSRLSPEATVVTTLGLDDEVGDRVSVESLGAPASDLVTCVESLDELTRSKSLVEAALVSWRHRIVGISEALEPVSAADSSSLGPIDIVGQPLLADLLAVSRSADGAASDSLRLGESDLAVLGAVIDDLDASIGFSVAGLEAAGDEVDARVLAAVEAGGWHQKLRLLLAAEEIYTSGLLAAVRRDPEAGQRLGARWVLIRRRKASAAAERFTRIGDRMRTRGSAQSWRTARKKRDAVGTVTVACEVYGASMAPAVIDSDFASTWAHAVEEFDRVENAVAVYDRHEDSSGGQMPIDEAAAQLGEIFASQLPNARDLVADIRRTRPHMTDADTIRHIKRQFVTRFQVDLADDLDIVGDVALLAMSLAEVRGIAPKSAAEFAETGRRLLDSSARIAAVYKRAGLAESAVVMGFERYFHKVQPMIMEAIFTAMEFAKPGKSGAARDFYKSMRKNVWGARHNRNVGKAAGAGAARGVRAAADASAPRLIVRTVDRAIAKQS